MSRKFIPSELPGMLLSTAWLASMALGIAQAAEGPRETLTTSRLPQTPQSTARIEAAKALAGVDADLQKTWGFFCTPTDYAAPGPELEALKVFDNLYMISHLVTPPAHSATFSMSPRMDVHIRLQSSVEPS